MSDGHQKAPRPTWLLDRGCPDSPFQHACAPGDLRHDRAGLQRTCRADGKRTPSAIAVPRSRSSALALLRRARRERPRGRRAAEQRDEIAAVHCPMPPVLPTERRDCCAAGFQSGPCRLGVTLGHAAMPAQCPLWPALRTQVGHFQGLTQPDIGSLIQSFPKKVGYIDLTQNCRSIWLLEISVSSALSRLEADHEHSASSNSIRGCVRRIDIS